MRDLFSHTFRWFLLSFGEAVGKVHCGRREGVDRNISHCWNFKRTVYKGSVDCGKTNFASNGFIKNAFKCLKKSSIHYSEQKLK
uniref:Secreted protein n=1 Tax=Parascaris univalens TaxID=6257 RepID=A0A914ZIX0_PARUN